MFPGNIIGGASTLSREATVFGSGRGEGDGRRDGSPLCGGCKHRAACRRQWRRVEENGVEAPPCDGCQEARHGADMRQLNMAGPRRRRISNPVVATDVRMNQRHREHVAAVCPLRQWREGPNGREEKAICPFPENQDRLGWRRASRTGRRPGSGGRFGVSGRSRSAGS